MLNAKAEIWAQRVYRVAQFSAALWSARTRPRFAKRRQVAALLKRFSLILQLYLAIPLWRGAYSATTALWLDGGAATGTKRGLLLLEGLVPTPTTIPAAAPRARSAAGAPRRGGCR
jgi:hypothetical protein